jgi:enoyl-CoA hydratase/carnithine racemase
VETFVDLEASLADADVVIEVVPEKMAIKKDVYGEVVEHAPDEAAFVTNTSSLSITEITEVTDRPERFCGMHLSTRRCGWTSSRSSPGRTRPRTPSNLLRGSPIAQRYTKRAMHAGRTDGEAGLEVEAMGFGHVMNTDDLVEGVTAFMGDGEPEFEGE